MKIITNKKKLIELVQKEKNVGFVPTMGAIHKGHISLIKKSKKQCKKTVLSIFINKAQFNKKNDYANYPRVLKRDVIIIKKFNIDILYIPKYRQIYPKGPNRKIKIDAFQKKLCGKYRPGHFRAVVDVIDRFVKIIQPRNIYFGEKDMQQLKLVESFLSKQHPSVKVTGCKTIREKNGLALSSRNFLLSRKQKKIASKIYKLLLYKKNKILKQKKYINKIKKNILKIGASKIDYLEILNVNKITKPYKKKSRYKIFIAYYLGSTRLIDNI